MKVWSLSWLQLHWSHFLYSSLILSDCRTSFGSLKLLILKFSRLISGNHIIIRHGRRFPTVIYPTTATEAQIKAATNTGGLNIVPDLFFPGEVYYRVDGRI